MCRALQHDLSLPQEAHSVQTRILFTKRDEV
jgi:hypothetical protein